MTKDQAQGVAEDQQLLFMETSALEGDKVEEAFNVILTGHLFLGQTEPLECSTTEALTYLWVICGRVHGHACMSNNMLRQFFWTEPFTHHLGILQQPLNTSSRFLTS